MNTPHDPGDPYDNDPFDLDPIPAAWSTQDRADDADEHWWPRMVDRINQWWINREPTGPALRQLATIPPPRARVALAATVAAVLLAVGSLIYWLIAGIVGVITGVADAIRASSGHTAANTVHDLTTWTLTRTITDPVHTYLTAHTTGLPVTADTVWWTWLATTAGLFALATFGSRGARIGWAIAGATTTAMVYTATPATGRPVAAGLTVTAWAVLSIVAYNRLAPSDRPFILTLPIPHRPRPRTDTTD